MQIPQVDYKVLKNLNHDGKKECTIKNTKKSREVLKLSLNEDQEGSEDIS